MTTPDSVDRMQWFVLRDLTRPIAKQPGYMRVQQAGLEVFTPMKWVVSQVNGRKTRRKIPAIHDLLFVHATREELDPVIDKTDTLQYRFVKGAAYRQPMTVHEAEMNRFIAAATATDTPKYYTPDEITKLAYGKRVRLVCDGIMNGYEGKLLAIRGSRKKKLVIEMPGLLAVEYEVSPEYVQFV